jgi:hypothetical protein
MVDGLQVHVRRQVEDLSAFALGSVWNGPCCRQSFHVLPRLLGCEYVASAFFHPKVRVPQTQTPNFLFSHGSELQLPYKATFRDLLMLQKEHVFS